MDIITEKHSNESVSNKNYKSNRIAVSLNGIRKSVTISSHKNQCNQSEKVPCTVLLETDILLYLLYELVYIYFM